MFRLLWNSSAAAQLENTTKELAYQKLLAVIDTVLDDIENT